MTTDDASFGPGLDGSRLPTTYCNGCGKTAKTRRLLENRYCATCYPVHRAAHQRAVAPQYAPKLVTCVVCGRPDIQHAGKGMCSACAKRTKRNGSSGYSRIRANAVCPDPQKTGLGAAVLAQMASEGVEIAPR